MLSLDVYEPPLLSVLVQGNSNQPHRKAVLYEELEGRPRATMEVSGNEDETRGTKHPHRDRGLGEVLPIGPELVGSGVIQAGKLIEVVVLAHPACSRH
jgi:hypothetical protein